VGIREWIRTNRLKNTPFYERTTYSFDGQEEIADDPVEGRQAVSVAETRELGVLTTCLGPSVEDVFWVVNPGENQLVIPQCSPVFSEVLSLFRKLPGFDSRAFGRSMSSTALCYFLCWERSSDDDNEVAAGNAGQ